MPFDPYYELLRGGMALVVGLAGAYAGALFAITKHQKERRWEAKHQAYQDVFKGISTIHAWADETYASTIPELPSAGTTRLEELNRGYELARQSLWSYVKVGELIICEKAVAILRDLLADLENERFRACDEPYDESNEDVVVGDHCAKVRDILDRRLPSLMSAAKEDLK